MIFRALAPSSLRLLFVAVLLGGPWPGLSSAEGAPGPRSLVPDRVFDVIPAPPWPGGPGQAMAFAGEALGDWKLYLAGVPVDGPRLVALAEGAPGESLEATLRVDLGRPVDLEDFIFFLDDVLRDGARGLRGELVWVTPGRARSAGILLHPDDVFAGKPRLYGARGALAIDRPRPQRNMDPARDGDPPGPPWAMRYRNPSQEKEALAALEAIRGDASFARRIRSLIGQLRAQGAEVYLNSSVRSPERGYLMWGAFILSRASSEAEVQARVERLRAARSEWELSVPIRWLHPAGWEATRDAARAMADTYEVVFATEEGARASDHYTGAAVDLVALALPGRLELISPRGASRSFDLSSAAASRDLSLSPDLIDWLEANWGLKKLRSDYPHWSDAE